MNVQLSDLRFLPSPSNNKRTTSFRLPTPNVDSPHLLSSPSHAIPTLSPSSSSKNVLTLPNAMSRSPIPNSIQPSSSSSSSSPSLPIPPSRRSNSMRATTAAVDLKLPDATRRGPPSAACVTTPGKQSYSPPQTAHAPSLSRSLSGFSTQQNLLVEQYMHLLEASKSFMTSESSKSALNNKQRPSSPAKSSYSSQKVTRELDRLMSLIGNAREFGGSAMMESTPADDEDDFEEGEDGVSRPTNALSASMQSKLQAFKDQSLTVRQRLERKLEFLRHDQDSQDKLFREVTLLQSLRAAPETAQKSFEFVKRNKVEAAEAAKPEMRLAKVHERAKVHEERAARVIERKIEIEEEQKRKEAFLAEIDARREAVKQARMAHEKLQERQMKWLTCICVLAKSNILSELMKYYRRVRKQESRRTSAAFVLQTRFFPIVMEFRERKRARAINVLKRCLWVFIMGWKICRKRKAIDVVRKTMLISFNSTKVLRYIRLFRTRVIRAQRCCRNFVFRRRAQLGLLSRQWELMEIAMLRAKKKAEREAMERRLLKEDIALGRKPSMMQLKREKSVRQMLTKEKSFIKKPDEKAEQAAEDNAAAADPQSKITSYDPKLCTPLEIRLKIIREDFAKRRAEYKIALSKFEAAQADVLKKEAAKQIIDAAKKQASSSSQPQQQEPSDSMTENKAAADLIRKIKAKARLYKGRKKEVYVPPPKPPTLFFRFMLQPGYLKAMIHQAWDTHVLPNLKDDF